MIYQQVCRTRKRQHLDLLICIQHLLWLVIQSIEVQDGSQATPILERLPMEATIFLITSLV